MIEQFKSLDATDIIGEFSFSNKALIGYGSQGQVYFGKDIKNQQRYVAIKSINLKTISKEYVANTKLQAKLLETLQSDHINKILKIHEDSQNLYTVSELCEQGTVRQLMQKNNGRLTEFQAKVVLSHVLKAMFQIIKGGLCHRDIKPENILIKEENHYQLSDYDNCIKISELNHNRSTKQLGTFMYQAPQILLEQKYTNQCDIWSIGVLFYELLTGILPYKYKSYNELVQNIEKLNITFPYDIEISKSSQDFIRGCLQVDESNRYSWTQIFSLSFVKAIKEPITLSQQNTLLQKIKNLQTQSKNLLIRLQKRVFEEFINIDELFLMLDKQNDNELDLKEITQLIQQIDKQADVDVISSIFKEFDTDQSHGVSLLEFKHILLDFDLDYQHKNPMIIQYRAFKIIKKLKYFVKSYEIDPKKLFQSYDKSGDNRLEANEFYQILKNIDPQIKVSDALNVFELFDDDNDKSMSLSQFQKLFSKNLIKYYEDQYYQLNDKCKKVIDELILIIQTYHLNVNQIFDNFDLNRNKYISQNEFNLMFNIIDSKIEVENQQKLFQYFDFNNDKLVDSQEFQLALLTLITG